MHPNADKNKQTDKTKQKKQNKKKKLARTGGRAPRRGLIGVVSEMCVSMAGEAYRSADTDCHICTSFYSRCAAVWRAPKPKQEHPISDPVGRHERAHGHLALVSAERQNPGRANLGRTGRPRLPPCCRCGAGIASRTVIRGRLET